eukprot:2817130-Rhodomonas_salina.1
MTVTPLNLDIVDCHLIVLSSRSVSVGRHRVVGVKVVELGTSSCGVPDQTQSLIPTTAQQTKLAAQSADIESAPTKAHDLGTDKLVQEDSVTMSNLIKDTINKIEGDQCTSRITTGFREIMHKCLNHTNDDDIVRLTQMAKD